MPTVHVMDWSWLNLLGAIVLGLAGSGIAGAWQPTDRNKRMAVAFARSATRASLSRKVTAAYMGVSETLLARQLEIRDGAHLSLVRMGDMPDEVLLNFAQELCDMTGMGRVVTDEKIDRLLHALEMAPWSMPELGFIRKVG